MRRNKAVWLLMLIVSVCALWSGRIVSAADATYTITVSGGKAYVDGEEVSKAKPGDSVMLVPDIQSGTYVSEWKLNGTSLGDDNTFRMPEGNVLVTAVRKSQQPLILDLTSTARLPGDHDYLLLYGTGLTQTVTDYLKENVPFTEDDNREQYYDFDGDNIPEARIRYVLYDCEDGFMTAVPGGTVRGDYKIDKPNALPYWPVVVRFGKNPVKETYAITVNGGYAADRDGNVITFAIPGQYVRVHYEWSDKTWLKEWKADGISNFHSYYYFSDRREYTNYAGMDESFIMPARDLTLRAVTGYKRPYTIDLTKGQAVIGYDVGYCLGQSVDPSGWNLFNPDLDRNGTTDIKTEYSFLNQQITITPCDTCSVTGSYRVDGLNSGQYWPITIKIGEVKPAYEITVVGGHAVTREWDDGISDYVTEAITSAAPGTEVFIIPDLTEGEYWTSWETDFSGIDKTFVAPNFYMPARDITVKAKTTNRQNRLVINLTNGLTEKDADFNRLRNAIYFMGDREDNGLVDFDDDGYYDIMINSAMDTSYPGDLWNCGELNAALSFNFEEGLTITPPDGIYAPIRIVAKRPAGFSKEKEYSITVVGGKAYAPDGTEVTSARPARKVYIVPDLTDVEKGMYVAGWTAESSYGEISYGDGNPDRQEFSTPDYDIVITIEKKLEKQVPLDINLTGGSFLLPAVYQGISVADALKPYADEESTDTEGTLDLNRDGIPDVIYTATVKEEYPELAFTKAGEEGSLTEDFETEQNLSGRYGSFRFIFGRKTDWIVVLDGQEDASLGQHLCFRTNMDITEAATDREWASMTALRGGISVRIVLKDSVPDTIEPVAVYYLDENGAKCEAVSENGSYRFTMPEANTTITAVFQTKKVVTPTPEEPKKDDGPEKEEEPEKKDEPEGKDGVNPWFILIPAFAFIIAVTTAVIILYNRKGRKAAAAAKADGDGPDTAAETTAEAVTEQKEEDPSEETAVSEETPALKDPEAEVYETDTPNETASAEKGTDDETEV
ncbi:MAG: hypothetical protein J5643_05360 [Lachnospiraceae bacterium]|nr:hypothetical protein [Lachnospiraceae bacterium]